MFFMEGIALVKEIFFLYNTIRSEKDFCEKYG